MLRLLTVFLLVVSTASYAQTPKKAEKPKGPVTRYESSVVRIDLKRVRVKGDRLQLMISVEPIISANSAFFYIQSFNSTNYIVDAEGNKFKLISEDFSLSLYQGQALPFQFEYELDGEKPKGPLQIICTLGFGASTISFGFTDIPVPE